MVTSANTTTNQWIRIGLLLTLLGGVGLALGRSLLFSKIGSPVTEAALDFPATMALPDWQFVGSQEIQERSLTSLKQVIPNANPSTAANGIPVFAKIPVASGRSYQYRQGSKQLYIEARYLKNTQGNVPDLLTMHPSGHHSSDRPAVTLQQKAGIGSYGIFTTQGTSYLSSCINPSGESTFTRQQFITYRLRADLAPDHLWRWLLNQAEIPDRRCVWVYMWIADSTRSNAAPSLETAWFAWSTAWRSQF